MKTRLFVLLLTSLFLSGCGATAVPTATLGQSTPTALAPQQPTSTGSIVTPTLGAATIIVTEPSATPDSTMTAEATATIPQVIMTVLPDGQQTGLLPSGVCQPPANWVAYTVQSSDTLSSLGQRTGTSRQQIQSANCLTSTTIFSGQILLLPFIPAPSTQPETLPTIDNRPPPNPGDPNLTVTPEQGPPGTLFIFTLDTFLPGETVTFIIKTARGREIYRTIVQMSSLGNALVTYQSPATAEARTYFAEALGGKSDSASFTITPLYP